MLNEKIRTLKLRPPVCVDSGVSVGQLIETVQKHRIGCVLVCENHKPIGMMTEREVLMKVVARDVKDSESVDTFMSRNPPTLTPENTIGDALALMNEAAIGNIPIVDPRTGEAVALFRSQDLINFLAETFPEQVINLPPRVHQELKTAEGA